MNTLRRLVALPLVGLELLVGCGGDGPMPPRSTGITVDGVVKDVGGEPISGAPVLVAGKSPVTSGIDGRFSIGDVQVPYDITVILSAQNTALAYKGLTRPDPTLLYLFTSLGALQSATVSGTTPPTSGKATMVLFVGNPHVFGASVADPTTGQYALTVSWRDAATSHAGQLYLLRFTIGSAGLPASYDGYATKPLTVAAGGSLSGNDFAAGELTDPSEQTVGGTVAVPAGYTLTSRSLWLLFGPAGIRWDEQGSLQSAFTYTVPALSNVVIAVSASAEDGSARQSTFFKSGISGNATDVSVALEPAARPTSPPDQATGVDVTTSFDWIQGGGAGVNVIEVLPYVTQNPRFYVVTAGTAAKVPDLAGAGMGLAAGARYRWFSDRIFPLASMDEAAGNGVLRLYEDGSSDLGFTNSEGFDFTTKAVTGAGLRAPVLGDPKKAVQPIPERPWMRGLHIISASRPSDRRLP